MFTLNEISSFNFFSFFFYDDDQTVAQLALWWVYNKIARVCVCRLKLIKVKGFMVCMAYLSESYLEINSQHTRAILQAYIYKYTSGVCVCARARFRCPELNVPSSYKSVLNRSIKLLASKLNLTFIKLYTLYCVLDVIILGVIKLYIIKSCIKESWLLSVQTN